MPTRIERGLYWDRAWSLVEGCTPVGPECLNCWSAAATYMRAAQRCEKHRGRYGGLINAKGKFSSTVRFNGTVRLMEGSLNVPLTVRKPTVWCVWNDLFHEDVPDEFIHKAMARIGLAGHHTFLVLTKRPDRMAKYFAGGGPVSTWGDIAKEIIGEPVRACFPQNLWLGTTVGHPESLWRIEKLLDCPAAVHNFLSLEPLLGPIDIQPWTQVGLECSECNWHGHEGQSERHDFDDEKDGWACPECGSPCAHWPIDNEIQRLIIGCETGLRRRPCKLEWVESLIKQADNAGVPVFVKALDIDGRVSKDPSEWPTWAQRREFP